MAYFGVLFYLLMLFIRPQEWSVFEGTWINRAPLMDWVVATVLVTWFAEMSHSKFRFRAAPQHLLVLGFFGATLMSHVRHTFLWYLIHTFKTFGKTVLLYSFIVTIVSSLKRVKTLVLVMLLGCVFMSLDGIWQYRNSTAGGGGPTEAAGFTGKTALVHRGAVRVRGMGIFNDPNDLALMLVMMLPFALSGVSNPGNSPASRLLSLSMVPAFVACIYFTNSRGGWLALGTMMVAYVYLFLRNKAFGVTLALIAFAALVVLGPSRLGTVSLEEGSTRGRIAAWGDGNRMLKRYPIFGVGKGRYTEFSSDGRAAHNSFVHCWGDLGLFGYFFWLALIAASAKDGYAMSRLRVPDIERQTQLLSEWRLQHAANPSRAGPDDGPVSEPEPPVTPTTELVEICRLGKALLAGLAGYLAGAFFLSRTYISPLYVFVGLVAVLRTLYERDGRELPGSFENKDLKWVLVLELASVPALWMLIRFVFNR